MRILSIETSADETGVSIVEADGDFPNATYDILGNALYSQVKLHEEYGGIFPTVAKREHAKTLVPLLQTALTEARLLTEHRTKLDADTRTYLEDLLHRESDMIDVLSAFLAAYERPPIDRIAVTNGPGLEPTLWVGVNFAKALAHVWNIPVVPVNHMEGHVLVSMFDGIRLPELRFPALALLISGGHTEFDLMRDWQTYECIGKTRDDAVGEAFDKSARLMGLPYPGGPEIGRLAASARKEGLPPLLKLPKPMLDSGDLDFSFSGLKTAVRYGIEGMTLSEDDKKALARDLEDTIATVLLEKTRAAIDRTGAQALIIGGGVSASQHIRDTFQEHFNTEYPDLALHIPERALSTDNSIMIALAGHARAHEALVPNDAQHIVADGNRALAAATDSADSADQHT